LLNGLIALQKKIDTETIRGARWYQKGPGEAIPVPLLGPDLIDPRRMEEIKALAAEKPEAEASNKTEEPHD